MIYGSRFTQLTAWLSAIAPDFPDIQAQLIHAEKFLTPASSDASFRQYFRLKTPKHSFIVMDAPPPNEHKNCIPFVRMATLLAERGLHVPSVLAADFEQGFLLLTDLGTQTWLNTLNAQNADSLFPLAIQSLILLQKAPKYEDIPTYDAALLQRELNLFPEWYLGTHCGIQLDNAQQQQWQALCDLLIESALNQPTVLVHRDYMPRNLMQSDPNPGVLDFQDAVYGPITYDITCLFKDAFISWPEPKIEQWLYHYWQQAKQHNLPVHEQFSQFQLASDLMGVQRHLKVIGIFARIKHRDGKPHYVQDIPRFFNYIRTVAERCKQLAPLQHFLAQFNLPENTQ